LQNQGHSAESNDDREALRMKKKKGRRAHGEGTIVQRADGRWAAALNIGWVGQKRKRKWLYGATQAEVRDKLTEARHKQQVGLPVDLEKQTLQQFLERWLHDVAQENTRPKTVEQYKYAVRRHLVPGLGDIALGRLATQDVQSFLKAKTDAGLSAKTVKHLRDVLRNALNVAIDWDLIVRNPAAPGKSRHFPHHRIQRRPRL